MIRVEKLQFVCSGWSPLCPPWPLREREKAGSVSDSVICLTDFFATAADVVGAARSVTDTMAEDSVSFFADLTGAGQAARATTIHHSVNGSFAIRQGKWKLNLCAGSGGWSPPRPGKETEGLPLVQLYNLEADPAEIDNLQAQYPEVVGMLVDQLAKEIKSGRSTAGTPQANEGVIPFSAELLAACPQLKQN